LIEADLAFMAPRIASYLAGEPEPQPCGGTDSVVAIYQRFETKDRPIVVALGNDGHWQRACPALGLAKLSDQPDLATNAGRRARRGAVVEEFQRVFHEMTAESALRILQSVGVPCSLINSVSEVVTDPQVLARGAITTQLHPQAGEFRGVNKPWQLASEADGDPATPAPLRGEHGRKILAEIGIEDEQLDDLVEAGVVWIP
jgi:crotonobetainyl-CoA:carnitine CoA-transferase CaiB-like acyl-CoA transferase